MEVMLWFLIPLAFVYYLDMEQKQKKLARRIQQLEKNIVNMQKEKSLCHKLLKI